MSVINRASFLFLIRKEIHAKVFEVVYTATAGEIPASACFSIFHHDGKQILRQYGSRTDQFRPGQELA